ncbi:heme ABC exporter ATP-binding protein CcmA [Terricaulis sp.]|uniref:heme ABC exporter ATP-binding protein CcmA n=1 Tax=Terricaulis sp. TaxID=2768686 RepID=UPI003784B995
MSTPGPFQDKPAIRVDGLAISRGGRILFEGLSFTADAGRFVEITGANGSGKTSLLRAIAGYLRPHAGQIRVEGVSEAPTAIHYIAHANALKGADTPGEHLRYWAGLFGGRVDEGALKTVGLARQAALPARVLSQGQARRLALSRLLIAPRPIWLLDEPAAALDAEGRGLLAGMIETHRRNGGLVLAAIHEPLGVAADQSVTVR